MYNLKKITKITLSFFIIFNLILLSTVFTAPAQDTIDVTINPRCTFQTFKGWGTSLSWWGNAIGGWKNGKKKNEILDLIFNDTSGL